MCEEGKPGSPLLASHQRTKSPSCWVLLQNKLRNSFFQVFMHQERQPQPCAKRVVSLSASDWHPKSYTPTCLYCWPNPQTCFICFRFSLLHQPCQDRAHDTSIVINEVSLSASLNKIAIAQYSISAPEKLY